MLKSLHPRTPIRLQINPIECGAVCLGIILDYYAYPNTQSQLNKLVGVSRNGSDAASLIKGAEHFGLEASGKMLSASEISKSPKPSIAFFDAAHFVVVEGYWLGKYFINDPARGRYSLLDKEFRQRYSGIEIAIKGRYRFQFKSPKSYLGMGFFSTGAVGGLLLSALLLSLSNAISFLHVSHLNLPILSIFALVLMIGFFLGSLRSVFLSRLDRGEREFQHFFIATIAKLSPAFFEDRPFSPYASILGSVNSFFVPLPTYFRGAILGALSAIYLIQALVFWPFSLLLMGMSGLIWLMNSLAHSSPFIRPDILKDIMNKFPPMDAMGQAEELIKLQLANDFERVRAHYDAIRQSKNRMVQLLLLTLIAILLECSIGQKYLNAGLLTHGEMLGALSFLMAVAGLSCLLSQKSGLNEDYQAALVNEMNIDAHHSVEKASETKDVLAINKGSFGFVGEAHLFSELNINLQPATLYALVGGPASGKSTLLRLMGKKLLLNSGELSMASSNKERIAFALIDDDAEIFSGTLLENVRVFDQAFSEHEVGEALKQSVIEELFYNRPMGLLSQIDHGGANLSGGQKKRLLLARALLRKPALLLLDNFFDSLDRECSMAVLEKLRRQGNTVVFTTFREWELALCDQVIFIDQGQVSIASHEYWVAHSLSYRSLIADNERGAD
jgi:ABC-type bacteriocin/lantibiotic exporter with double-glycine peptidase domain